MRPPPRHGGRSRLRRDGSALRLLKLFAAIVVLIVVYLVLARSASDSSIYTTRDAGKQPPPPRTFGSEKSLVNVLTSSPNVVVHKANTDADVDQEATTTSRKAEEVIPTIPAANEEGRNDVEFSPLDDSPNAVCWCHNDIDLAWAVAVAHDAEANANANKASPLINIIAPPAAASSPSAAKLATAAGQFSVTKRLSHQLSEAVSSEKGTTMHVYRGPCDTYHRQMREFDVSREEVVEQKYLRGHYETCAVSVSDPFSVAPFSGQRDVRADIVPSCAERTQFIATEVNDFWYSAEAMRRSSESHNTGAHEGQIVASLTALTRREACTCSVGEKDRSGFRLQAPVGDTRLEKLLSVVAGIVSECENEADGAEKLKSAAECRKRKALQRISEIVAEKQKNSEATENPENSDANTKKVGGQYVPRAHSEFNLADFTTLAHPSRDALCLAESQAQMSANPTIELLPTEEEEEAVQEHGLNGKSADAANLHVPHLVDVAFGSFGVLKALQVSALHPNTSWPSSWSVYSKCPECVRAALSAATLSSEENQRRLRIEAALSKVDASSLNTPSAVLAAASKLVTVDDLMWYGARVVLGSHGDKTSTTVFSSSGPAGLSYAKQQEIFRLAGLEIPSSLAKQDQSLREAGEKLYAQITHARLQSLYSNRRVLAQADNEAPPRLLGGDTSLSEVNLFSLQLAAIASAQLDAEGKDNSVLAASILGPHLLSKSPKLSKIRQLSVRPDYSQKLESYKQNAAKYRLHSGSQMRRDEVAIDFCLARLSKPIAQKATGGDRSILALRRSLLVNTLNGAPLVCYEGNDVVCHAVKSHGVWESHLHTLLRASVLRIRSEVRLAATILKEREALLMESSKLKNISLFLADETERGVMATWHPESYAFEKLLYSTADGKNGAKATRTSAMISAIATSPSEGTSKVVYDRFGFFLRPTTQQLPVELKSSAADTKSHQTRVPKTQLAQLTGVGESDDASSIEALRRSFASNWIETTHQVHQKYAYAVSTEALPEVFDRRVDIEFATEDAMNTLKHLSDLPSSESLLAVKEVAAGPYAEVPSIPVLISPSGAAGEISVRNNRNQFDEDVLFMDAGANVGSFAFDIRIGGSTAYRSPTDYAPFRDAMPIHNGLVVDGAAVTNFMLLEALPANVFLLETTRCLNTVREYSTWRKAVDKVVGLFNDRKCFEGGVQSCTTQTRVSFYPVTEDWTAVPSQVTSPDFHAIIMIESSFGAGNTTAAAAAASEHHHTLLQKYLKAFSNCSLSSFLNGEERIASQVVCKPPSWAPTLHHVALGDRDSEGEDSWCVLTSDFGNLADTLLTCDPSEVKQARELAKTLETHNVPMGHPDAFSVIPPQSQIRGRLLPSSFVQLKTLDAVIKGRYREPIEGNAYAELAVRTLLQPRGIPPAMLNHAMAKRFEPLIAQLAEHTRTANAEVASDDKTENQTRSGSIRPSRATSLVDLLVFVCTQKPFLKMDVESFEPFVLKGLSKTIANPLTRPLLVLTEAWRSDELVRQSKRMINEFNYIGVTVEVESWSSGKNQMHVIANDEDVDTLNNRLLGTDMNTIVWVQKGYEDFMPQIISSSSATKNVR